MNLHIPIEMESLPPPPPYTPRDDLTPTSSAEASPVTHNDSGPSHDYSAYEQVLPGTDPDLPEPDEPLPAYHPGSHRSNVDRNVDLPAVPRYSDVPLSSSNPASPGVSRAPPRPWPARAPSNPANFTRDASPTASSGLSALQRVIDLSKQLSERSADQVARSVRAGLTPRRDQRCRTVPVRGISSSSTSSLEDPLSGQDFRALDDLDLTTLRSSIANLMRDPRNQDEILQAVDQLRDDLHNRRDRTVLLKQQVKDFNAEIHANRKKVRAMREEARAAKKAEDKERKLERRAEKRAMKGGLSTDGRDSAWVYPA